MSPQDAKALERLPKPRRTLTSSYNDGVKSLTQDPQFYDVPDYVGYDMARTAAFDLGRSGGVAPRWVMAERIGKLPEGGRSKNFAEDRMEKGISVLRILGEGRSDVGTYEIFNKGQKRYVAGWLIGTGSDGEPLLVDAVDLGPVEEVRLNPKLKHGLNNRERIMRNPVTRQTETPEFKRWFGESVVVDANGDPLVAYHGTSKDKPFSSFTRNAQGTWFTSDPESASSYAMTNDSQKVVYEDGRYVSKNTSSHVIPVYLSIKNPLKVEGELLEKWRRSVNYRAANKLLVSQAKYAGHDGLIFPGGVFVVFDPTQIKSSIGNRGTFDPTDPDIRNPKMTSRVHYRLNPDSKGKGMNTVRSKLSQIIEPGDRMVCYDTASGEDFYRLWDIVHTAFPLTEEALTEIEGMLDDDGVLVIESGETPAGLQDHFRKATRYNGLLLVQGPKDPEGARIKTEELRRELE